VLLHGLLMDSSLWADVVAELSPGHRCVVPTLPLGGHRRPMGSGTELTLQSVAEMVVELLERLALDNVTVIGNDTGGAIAQLLVVDHPARIGSLVLVSCEAFENFPPGLTGKALVLMGRLPRPLFGALMKQLRIRPIRRLHQLLSDRAIQLDAVRILRSIAADRDLLTRTAESLSRFQRPSLIVWGSEDRVMPPAHGRRLAELLPQSRLIEIADTYTLIPLDQPVELATALREFLGGIPRA
jgi:pimeloyl-ACP methyl ester carboxylesterase